MASAWSFHGRPWPARLPARACAISCRTVLATGSQVFNSVLAVLAISVVVSAFPVLSARDGPAFDQVCASSTRAVLLLSWLGTGVIAAIAIPAARVLARQPDQVPELVE